MSRPGGLIALIAMLVLPAAAAADSIVAPYTMSTGNFSPNVQVSATCNVAGTSTVTWSATSGSSGNGESWSISGTIQIGPQTGVRDDGRPFGPVTSWSASFDLDSTSLNRHVDGEQSLRPGSTPVDEATCIPGIPRADVQIFTDRLIYTATVVEGQTQRPDRGLAVAELDDNPNGFPGRYFASTLDEQPDCDDGIDNDGDGFTDWSATSGGDPECTEPADTDESPFDETPPEIDLRTPADDARYELDQAVAADYSCTDEIDSAPSCDGTVPDGAPIDTSTPGKHDFTVTSQDADGNRDSVTHRYIVEGSDPERDIAFHGRRVYNNEIDEADIFVSGSYGGDERQRTDANDEDGCCGIDDRNPSWSPDGDQLVFDSERGDDEGRGLFVTADPDQPVRIQGDDGATLAGTDPSWGPDDVVAYTHFDQEEGQHEIATVPVAGGAPTVLTDHEASDRHAAWSPDGERIAFTSDRDGKDDIWVMDADGSDPVQLTDDELHSYEPAWSPDGAWIVFVANRDDTGDEDLWVMRADGSEERLLFENGDSPAFSPDCLRVAFEAPVLVPGSGGGERRRRGISFVPQDEIFTAKVDGGERARVTTHTGDDGAPEWEPDATALPDCSGLGETPANEISISDVAVDEGDDATFTLELSQDPVGDVSVDYATEDRTADAGDDYESASGTVTFDGRTAEVTVETLDDQDGEADETFLVRLSDPEGAEIDDGTGVGTILDDDGGASSGPTVTIDDTEVAEADELSRTATFTVTLSDPALDDVDVEWATADGTALAGADYTAESGTLTIPAGQTSGEIDVTVLGDRLDEVRETFHVDLSGAEDATLGSDRRGTAGVVDDDAAPPVLLRDAYVLEGNEGTRDAVFRLELAKRSGRPVTVSLATADETATAGSDYDARTATVTLAPGTLETTIGVAVRGDAVREPDFERFRLEITGSSNPLDTHRAIGTIVDDEPGPGVAVVSAPETRLAAPLATLSRAPAQDAPAIAVVGSTLLLRRDGTVRVRVLCARRACRGAVRLALRGRVLGFAGFRARSGRSAEASVRLGRAARRTVGRRARIVVDVTVNGAGRRVHTMELRRST